MMFDSIYSHLKPLINFDTHPISNRFLVTQDQKVELYPYTLGQCQKTGVILQINPVSWEELVPQYGWISYNEPEAHLDQMLSLVLSVTENLRNGLIGGVSYKDDSLLDRFQKFNYSTKRLDIQSELGIMNSDAGVVTIQELLNPDLSRKITKKIGKFDIIIARHIVEHAYNLPCFLNAIGDLVQDNGYVIFEIPDCSSSIRLFDYTMLWEEHLFYFTPYSFSQVLYQNSFDILKMHVFPYPYEDSLVVIAQRKNNYFPLPQNGDLIHELMKGDDYAFQYGVLKYKILNLFRSLKEKGKISFFGAGHMACSFIWNFELQPFVDFIIDDNPHKIGMFLSGSRIPIVSSEILFSSQISCCILSMNPISEEKVKNIFVDYVVNGGRFLSIFPNSKDSLYHDLS